MRLLEAEKLLKISIKKEELFALHAEKKKAQKEAVAQLIND